MFAKFAWHHRTQSRFSWHWWSSTKTYSPNVWSTWRGQRKSAKLVGVIKRTFPRMKGFKRGLKINTWTLDQCLTLKDQPAQKLADGERVCTYTYVHITDYSCQMSWLLHIDFPPPSGCKSGPWLEHYPCECLVSAKDTATSKQPWYMTRTRLMSGKLCINTTTHSHVLSTYSLPPSVSI